MNLLHHLLSRIVAVALLCLLASTAYVLADNDRTAKQATWRITEALAKQLSFQQLQISSGFTGASPFPDFSLWKQTRPIAGLCVKFTAANSQQAHSLCTGEELASPAVPPYFTTLYRWFFTPGLAMTQTITLNGRTYGLLTVTPSADLEVTQAWENSRRLLGLSVTTVFAVCVLVYLSIRRALYPAQTIVQGLAALERGELAYRLPPFALAEWQRIAEAINQLAASQAQLLGERQRLAVQLLNLQEEERRYLAQELHDEFGQCLAAINAVTASIAQTAAQHCPEILADTGHISQITGHMLNSVRSLLARLRPAELDELGLAASLQGLIANWNAHSGTKTQYRLTISGACGCLPEALALTLFRISQECLTNIAKHAAATTADLTLAVGMDTVDLTVTDNGSSSHLPLPPTNGIGLLGIRERVTALQGQLSFRLNQPQGLQVAISLPLQTTTGAAL
ncbi:sensor histidine kinase [Methylovulum psychrotolerans]|uniref:Sensor histidine kinase n=1 Tax=Methylovulum psychrotolerans TaxID=1704499 RepID=A0A1Z4C0I3_9GAMM|nr:sensor histidine kinase [Methylovulum psychrotolerans]ASF47036.1 sensor histidine kinase [Methylovulum psychrotolerans]